METDKPVVLQAGRLSGSPGEKGVHVFPNRATYFENLKTKEQIEVYDESIAQELHQAGIEFVKLEPLRDTKSEVPTNVFGEFRMWAFRRAWYYWVAKGPGIPPEYAIRLHKVYGREVRVDGHCGCPSPLEWFKGFGVGHYHIDSQRGLKALADCIRQVYEDAKIKYGNDKVQS